MNDRPTLEEHKIRLCEIGARLYQKGFAAANEGNLSIRLDQERVLCTPTLHCKGFMKPDDLCVVDMAGNQLEGNKRRTSEVLLHIEIYKNRPDINSVVHCHPPHATAFAVAREPIPICVLPEPDIFLGEVPIAGYETPGSQDFADTIRPFVRKTNLIVLANHGTVSYEGSIERAYWLTEILDAYCRILILAKQLGGIHHLSAAHGRALLKLRQEWGFDDPRHEMDIDDRELVEFAAFGDQWHLAQLAPKAFGKHPESTRERSDASPVQFSEAELDRLADRIAARLQSRS